MSQESEILRLMRQLRYADQSYLTIDCADLRYLLARVERQGAELERIVAAALEAANAESELDEREPTSEEVDALLAHPVESLRAVVRAAKKSIRCRILSVVETLEWRAYYEEEFEREAQRRRAAHAPPDR